MYKKGLSIFVIYSLVCFLFITCSKSDQSSKPHHSSNLEKVTPISLTGGEGLGSSVKILKEVFKDSKDNVVVSGLSVDLLHVINKKQTRL